MKRFVDCRYSVIVILFFGLALRLISLNQSFWLDEATSGIVVRDLGFKEIVSRFSAGDFHPPFYYLLLKIWALFFGYSEVGLRSLSIVAGLGSIFMVYLISKTLFNRKIALVSALFLASSGLHLYFSQEARMYSLATFFACLAIYLFVKISQKGRVGEWILFSLVLGLLSATQYYLVFIFLVFWLVAYLERKTFSWWKKFLASHIIFVLFLLFWFPYFISQIKNALAVRTLSPAWWQVLGKGTSKEIFLVPIKFMIGRISFEDNRIYAVLIIVLGGLFGFYLLKAFKKLAKTRIIWLWLTVPFFASLATGLATSGFSYFRLLFILPAFYILMAIGLAGLTPKWFKLSLLAVLIINLLTSVIYLFDARFHREDWRELTRFIESQSAGKKSVVLMPANSQMEAFHYYRLPLELKGGELPKEDYEKIWLVRYVQPIFDPEDSLKYKVEATDFIKIAEYDFNGVVVWAYQK